MASQHIKMVFNSKTSGTCTHHFKECKVMAKLKERKKERRLGNVMLIFLNLDEEFPPCRHEGEIEKGQELT